MSSEKEEKQIEMKRTVITSIRHQITKKEWELIKIKKEM
jgi:hypothetical protein